MEETPTEQHGKHFVEDGMLVQTRMVCRDKACQRVVRTELSLVTTIISLLSLSVSISATTLRLSDFFFEFECG